MTDEVWTTARLGFSDGTTFTKGITLENTDPLKPGHFIIGIGGNMKCGKTLAADHINDVLNQYLPERYDEYVSHRTSFAKKLKEIATLMGWDGKKDERGRRLLQHLGTEVGRAYDPDMWVKHVVKEAQQWWTGIVVIDDCRFPNEVDWCNKYGTTIRITREVPSEYGADHISETLMDHCTWRHSVSNNGTIEDLYIALTRRMIEIIEQNPEPFINIRSGHPFQERTA